MARKKARREEQDPEDRAEVDSEPEQQEAELPEHLRIQRDYVVAGEHLNYHTNTVTSALAYLGLGVDNQWDVKAFKKNLRVDVASITKDGKTTEEDMEFDMIGIDPSIVNALRRILLEEIPTMAIEHVFMINNTSSIPDEMLALRLGLIPIKADAALFAKKAASDKGEASNCIVFKFKADCRKRLPSNTIVDDAVKSNRLEWLPRGSEIPDETRCSFAGQTPEQRDQSSMLPEGCHPVHEDILVAKLGPGQSIEAECIATKGTGAEHAKWSPVATAWHRLQPEAIIKGSQTSFPDTCLPILLLQVALLQPIEGEDAEELAGLLPELCTVQQEGGKAVARIADARQFPMLHEKARKLSSEDRWRGRLQFRKRKDHFIFTIQSTGILPPDVLFTRALDELSAKCGRLLERL